MPLEGQWERQNTPLRRLSTRERRLAWAVAAATAVCVLIGTFFIVSGHKSAADRVAAGCVRVISGSTMGGVAVQPCGAAAVALCRSYATRNGPGTEPFHAACREAGIK